MTKTLLLALYIAFALALVFPPEQSPVPMSVLFVIATVIIFLLLKNSRAIREKKKDLGINLIVGILAAGVFVTGLYYFAGDEVIAQIPEAIRVIFINQWALVGWFLVPLIILSLLRGKRSKE